MLEQQLAPQHRIDGLGQGGALARAERAVLAEVARHDRVGGMVELQDLRHELGAGLQQGFGMHAGVSYAGAGSSSAMARG